MKKRITSLPRLALLAALLLLLGGNDVALGSFIDYPDLDFSSSDLNVGFTLDTAVARDRLFNYRLNLNYVHGWIDPKTVPGLSPNAETRSDGLDLENVFGFGVIRRPDLRWWIGPMFRISIERALSVDANAAQYFASPLLNVGAGIVTGVNLHRGKHMSAGLTLGYDINYALFE